jgi:hypothetical protein
MRSARPVPATSGSEVAVLGSVLRVEEVIRDDDVLDDGDVLEVELCGAV